MNRNLVFVVAGCLVACCCLAVLGLALAGGVLWFQNSPAISPVFTQILTELNATALSEADVTATPVRVFTRTPRPGPTASPAPVGAPTLSSAPTLAAPTLAAPTLAPAPSPAAGSLDTLTTLEKDIVPSSDLRQLAMRLKGIKDIPEVVSAVPANHALGDEVQFFVSNQDTLQNTKVTAKLAYMTENVYFFVQAGVTANLSQIKSLVDEFQTKTYPTDREFFGSEWTPGVDGDPRLYILFTRGTGAGVAGYFVSASEYSLLAHPYSNEKEMFFLNADLDLTYPWSGVLAHEFQHMIHWYHDRNEETWMNEGASMLAEEINGFDVESFDLSFLSAPDLQLNTWSDSSDPNTEAHYGAAYLFMKYFLDRFGEQATKALVANQANGMIAVDDTLASLTMTDPATGKTLTVDDVFADWTIANYLNDGRVGDGRYAYKNYSRRVEQPTDTVVDCPSGTTPATVHQFAANYTAIDCTGSLTVNFTGSRQVQLVPATPHSGRYAFWSNRADESDTTLTRDFDLSGLTTATLNYWAWWQIEKNWDFAYVVVSTDDGQTWTMLHVPSGTSDNPVGNNIGWGYTGCSGGGDPAQDCQAEWVKESVDLSAYAGKKIKVRFESVTDAALDYPSLLVDDISIPEINYSCNFEADACGWQADGFARVDNLLPQTFSVQVILTSGGRTTILPVPLDASNQGHLPLNLKQGDTAILVVSGTTLFTTETASYEYQVK